MPNEKRLAIRPYFRKSLFAILSSIGYTAFAFIFDVEFMLMAVVPIGLIGLFGLLPGITIDVDKRMLIKRGWLPWLRHSWRLDLFDSICLFRIGLDYVGYAVGLAGQDSRVELLGSVDHYLTARRYAEQIAKLLQMDIYDSALGNPVIHTAHSASGEPSPTSRSAAEASDAVTETIDSSEWLSLRDQVGTRERLAAWFFCALGIAGTGIGALLAAKKGEGSITFVLGFMSLILAGLFWYVMRSGVVIDGTNRRIRSWQFLYRNGAWKSLAGYDVVTLAFVQEWFTVGLDGPEGYLAVYCFRDRDEALDLASRVAKMTRLEFRDLTLSTIDKPQSRDMILGPNWDGSFPEPPEGARTCVERELDTVVFHIPARGAGRWKLPMLLGMMLPVTLPLALLVEWLLFGKAGGELAKWAFLGNFFGYPLLLVFVIIPKRREFRRRETVYVSSTGIRIDSRSGRKRWNEEMSLEEVQGIEVGMPTSCELTLYSPHLVVRVCGPARAVEFGGSLQPKELVWLREAVASRLFAEADESKPI